MLEQDGKPPDVNEILLMEESGAVVEGMSSNLFVLSGGTVLTAGEGVLIGTVRNLVLKVTLSVLRLRNGSHKHHPERLCCTNSSCFITNHC